MSTYEISKSSLLSLKAEILRKQQELHKVKTQNENKIKTIKRNTPLQEKHNEGLESRIQKDEEQNKEENENLLRVSQHALKAKAELYDKLSQLGGKLNDEEQDECKKRYLVQFDKKQSQESFKYANSLSECEDEEQIVDPLPKDETETWVEFVDCLGRSRRCLRKDLEHFKKKDKELMETVEKRKEGKTEQLAKYSSKTIADNEQPGDKTKEAELLSADMRKEFLRQQWEKEEELLKDKDNVHYQDILFNEARTHGVSYYNFSKDEEVRRKQQEELKNLREETKAQQRKAAEMKEFREKQLRARIQAAKERKRIRLGLPPTADDDIDTSEDGNKHLNAYAKGTQEMDEDKKEEANLIAERKRIEETKKMHLRPWDIGKEMDGCKLKKEHYEYSQEEWVEKKRKERPTEFAPPTSYDKLKKRRLDIISHSSHIEESVEAGLKFLRQQIEKDQDFKK